MPDITYDDYDMDWMRDSTIDGHPEVGTDSEESNE